MTKKELGKIIRNKGIKIFCIKDYDAEVKRYTRENRGEYLLNDTERNVLINLYKQFPNEFWITSENTFTTDETIYRIN